MTNGVIAFLLAIGSATWVYQKFHRSTGGNTQNSLIGSAVVGVLIFAVTLLLLNMIPE